MPPGWFDLSVLCGALFTVSQAGSAVGAKRAGVKGMQKASPNLRHRQARARNTPPSPLTWLRSHQKLLCTVASRDAGLLEPPEWPQGSPASSSVWREDPGLLLSGTLLLFP